jgi:hypothetical protein
VFGKSIPKARSKPNIAPEAPTVGTLIFCETVRLMKSVASLRYPGFPGSFTQADIKADILYPDAFGLGKELTNLSEIRMDLYNRLEEEKRSKR